MGTQLPYGKGHSSPHISAWSPISATAELLMQNKLKCGPMFNVMAALPNIGGALCSTPQSLADAHYYSAVQ